MNTALAAALDGKPVSAAAAPKALQEAAEKLTALKAKFSVAKENASSTAMAGLHAMETVVVLGASGAAEGYWGEDKMKWGPVPIRAALGVGLTGWGLAATLMGGSGGHQLAVGTGLMGADAYSLGRQGGIALREKKGAAAAGTPVATEAQKALIAANPGAKLLNGKVVAANGSALEGDDLGELARLVRLQRGTAGERELVRRDAPAGAVRRASRA